jgi:hypothetical protein
MTSIFIIGVILLVVVYAIVVTAVLIYAKSTGKDAKSTIILLVFVLAVALILLTYNYVKYQSKWG